MKRIQDFDTISIKVLVWMSLLMRVAFFIYWKCGTSQGSNKPLHSTIQGKSKAINYIPIYS